MRYLINGLPASPAAVLACIATRANAAGVDIADVLPDGLATAQSEWGRDYIADLSGYVVECIPTNTAERESFYAVRPAV